MPFCKGAVWIRKKLSPYKRAFFTETLVAKPAKQLSRKKTISSAKRPSALVSGCCKLASPETWPDAQNLRRK